tara:strand:- start:15025 stop:15351 length:327 start_codon:yes stop_codon:yes gene_type:complete
MIEYLTSCFGSSKNERQCACSNNENPYGPTFPKYGGPPVHNGNKPLRVRHEKARRNITHLKKNNRNVQKISIKYNYELETKFKKKKKSLCEKVSKVFKKSKDSQNSTL